MNSQSRLTYSVVLQFWGLFVVGVTLVLTLDALHVRGLATSGLLRAEKQLLVLWVL